MKVTYTSLSNSLLYSLRQHEKEAQKVTERIQSTQSSSSTTKTALYSSSITQTAQRLSTTSSLARASSSADTARIADLKQTITNINDGITFINDSKAVLVKVSQYLDEYESVLADSTLSQSEKEAKLQTIAEKLVDDYYADYNESGLTGGYRVYEANSTPIFTIQDYCLDAGGLDLFDLSNASVRESLRRNISDAEAYYDKSKQQLLDMRKVYQAELDVLDPPPTVIPPEGDGDSDGDGNTTNPGTGDTNNPSTTLTPDQQELALHNQRIEAAQAMLEKCRQLYQRKLTLVTNTTNQTTYSSYPFGN